MLRGSENYIWNVTEILGQGATGNVYKCRNKKTGELFAVKTFNSVSYGRPMDVQMREFEVLKKLCHENIVQLHAIEEEMYVHSKVLVMDLCTGGSLFNILDDPENAYGIEESEFVSVLHDVAAGLKHLRDNGIVHRDIKPGNIMRFITEDGRSVYKLIDFGAARQLQDEEQFMSLYGTEEYLYPDMYERAVLRRPTSKQFTATVDLWSLGVTLYHVASGQLPFRPFGGSRRNKELMYTITTEKASGVISGIQHTEGGPIEWSRQLPPTCRLSKGLMWLVTPLLAGLLESDPERMMKFEQFFETVQDITSKRVIFVFHPAMCTILHIYIDAQQQMAQLQDQIAEQTGVRTSNQQILFENHELSKIVGSLQPISTYPYTSPSNPFYLFDAQEMTQDVRSPVDAVFTSIIPTVPSAPRDTTKEQQLGSDALYAKNCCAVVHAFSRTVSALLRHQLLICKAAKMFRLVLLRDIEQLRDDFSGFTTLVAEVGKRVDLLIQTHKMMCGAVSELSTMKCRPVDGLSGESFTKENEQFIKLNELVAKIQSDLCDLNPPSTKQSSQDSSWMEDYICHDTDNCEKKSRIHVENVRQTLADFARDIQLKRLSFNEEQIHNFEKHKMKTNAMKANTLVREHCLPNTRRTFEAFTNWYSGMRSKQRQLTSLKSHIDTVVTERESLTDKLDQMQKQGTGDMKSLLQRLDVDVMHHSSQLVPSPTHTTTLTIDKSFAAANGEFVFRRRHREKHTKIMQNLNQSLARNSAELKSIKGIIDDNEKCLRTLCDVKSQPFNTYHVNDRVVAYTELDDSTPTLTSA